MAERHGERHSARPAGHWRATGRTGRQGGRRSRLRGDTGASARPLSIVGLVLMCFAAVVAPVATATAAWHQPPADGSVAQTLARSADTPFVTITPVRAFDSRTSSQGPLGPGATRRVPLGALAPPGATGVVVTLTATGPTAATHLTLWPAGAAMPATSNLNIVVGESRANTVVLGLGADRTIEVANAQGSVDVVIDVTGWFVGGFVGVSPFRAADTRLDGVPLRAGTPLDVVVAGTRSVPSGAVAVAVNITATNPETSTHLTVWPAGAAMPATSTVNITPTRTVAGFALVGVGRGGAISLANFAGRTDVIVDVLGWFTDDSGIIPAATPTRVFDSRAATCGARLGPGETRTLRVTDRTDVAAVAFTLTAVDPGADTFVRIWPTGSAPPSTSNLNVGARQSPTANLVVTAVGAAGQIDVFSLAGHVDLVIDVVAIFGGSTPPGTPAPCPSGTTALDPSAGAHRLVVRPDMHRVVGTDRIAVWVCEVPANTTHPAYVRLGTGRTRVDASAVAAFANEHVAPFFAAASTGRYRTVFEPAGRFALAPGDGPLDCLDAAEDRTDAPFTNTLAVDTSTALSGLAGPGLVWSTPTQRGPLDSGPPSTTSRGAYVGGAGVSTFPSQSLIAHEIGHTLHWGHSHLDPFHEYDNPVDLMSDQPRGARCLLGAISYTCRIHHTIAFNRYAAGWIDDVDVAVHRGGRSNALLTAPARPGTQMLVAIDPDTPDVVLTVEARPRLGYDEVLDAEGVALHIVDQRREACSGFAFLDHCLSTERRQRQAVGPSGTSAHLVAVGGRISVHGLTVEVLRRTADGYAVEVTGSFDAPAAARPRAATPVVPPAVAGAERLLPAAPYWPAP